MWDCRDPFRNRNAESMGLRLVRVFFPSLVLRFFYPTNKIANEYELRKSARTEQQKGETNENDKMILLVIFVDLYININIYVFVRTNC